MKSLLIQLWFKWTNHVISFRSAFVLIEINSHLCVLSKWLILNMTHLIHFTTRVPPPRWQQGGWSEEAPSLLPVMCGAITSQQKVIAVGHWRFSNRIATVRMPAITSWRHPLNCFKSCNCYRRQFIDFDFAIRSPVPNYAIHRHGWPDNISQYQQLACQKVVKSLLLNVQWLAWFQTIFKSNTEKLWHDHLWELRQRRVQSE